MGRNIVLSAGSTLLAVVAFAVGVVAVSTPYWATFEDFIGSERGHFGPWTVCRQRRSEYRCGSRVSKMQPSEYTTAAGVCGVIAVIVTVLLCVTSPMVLAMRVTQRQVFFKFRTAVLAKLVISCLGVTSCVLSLILFGIDLDARRLGEETGYRVSRAWSFYLLVLFLALCMTLCAFSAAEFVLARRLGGDPVKFARDPSGSLAPVIANPAAREKRLASPNTNGVTVIVAQQPRHVHQRPSNGTNGTRGTNGTNGTSGTNGTRGTNGTGGAHRAGQPIPYDPRKSPLRSSLKKKRVEKRESSDESIDSGVIIIGNPAPSTPLAGRSKKVRIQTLDTAV